MAECYGPAVAFDGMNYLVVWHDYRNDGMGYNIRGSRVSASGEVLDPDAIAVSSAPGNQIYPAIAFDGTDYFVAWSDARNGGANDIYAARITQSGQVIDPEGIAISVVGGDQSSPAVAFDGTNYFVTWQDGRSQVSSDIYGARVSSSGAVLDSIPITISTSMYLQSEVTLVYGGMSCMAVWTDRRNGNDSDVFASRLDQAGHVIDPDGIAVSMAASNQMGPASWSTVVRFCGGPPARRLPS